MYQYTTKNSTTAKKQKSLKSRPVYTQRHIIQMCGGITGKSAQKRNGVHEFFNRLKIDNTPQKSLYVYSFVHSDGLGDAGQLKLLYDKVDSKKTDLGLQNIRMLCAFSLTDQIQQWKANHKENEDPPENELENIKEHRKTKIQDVCGVQDGNIKYTDGKNHAEDGKRHIRENAFDTNADWEVEYPVPDPDFMFPGDKSDHLLKIKEMGAEKISLTQYKAGDPSFDGIGYGIPDSFNELSPDNENSAENFLSHWTNIQFPKALLWRAWIVSVKNYICNSQLGNKYTDFPEEKMKLIVEKAKKCGALLVIFAGMPKLENKNYQVTDGIHIICDDIAHDTLKDLMAKITSGVIISGGEGLFAESLASPDNRTASIMAARYGFQYQEIAYSLLANSKEKQRFSKNGPQDDKSYIAETYRIAFNNGKFYYMVNENSLIEILEHSISNEATSYNELADIDICFSKDLSALWLPLSINSSLQIQEPKIFENPYDTLEVFLEQKKRLANCSWFSLIDNIPSE